MSQTTCDIILHRHICALVWSNIQIICSHLLSLIELAKLYDWYTNLPPLGQPQLGHIEDALKAEALFRLNLLDEADLI
ncbi:hypothetical protein ACJX0J_040617, partial [Zea mays]